MMTGSIPIRMAALLLAAGLSQFSFVSSVNAQDSSGCEKRSLIVINATQSELVDACKALTDVVTYFRNIGFGASPDISITFQDRSLGTSGHASSAYGYFDATRSEIAMFRAFTAQPWGLDWDRQLASSFLRHELVHAALRANLKDDSARLRPEWHEFIAYTVQLALMDARLRARLLERYTHVGAFAHLTEVNEFTSRMNPETFAISAYKTYLVNGADKFIQKLLRFEVQPPPMSYPFPVLPGQIPGQ
ncbi:hypothetical protein TH25_17240 [Thalassospira profundimaris]|uniref:Peptidase MA-like domain-containing protein n=1 Tax=Thalassospira profundimaris TaxID=502049 RepID=A0A367WX03_9PROT|nr:DUF6639 family protein [Thalassospira profundimaris]RCK45975.1 hypothetical protein TH25_17240 [Thalassospira profundimaris]